MGEKQSAECKQMILKVSGPTRKNKSYPRQVLIHPYLSIYICIYLNVVRTARGV